MRASTIKSAANDDNLARALLFVMVEKTHAIAISLHQFLQVAVREEGDLSPAIKLLRDMFGENGYKPTKLDVSFELLRPDAPDSLRAAITFHDIKVSEFADAVLVDGATRSFFDLLDVNLPADTFCDHAGAVAYLGRGEYCVYDPYRADVEELFDNNDTVPYDSDDDDADVM